MNKSHEPLLIWSSVLVGLQILAGGAALADVVGQQPAGLFILAVAALQGGTQFYIRGQVTPNADVAASVVKGKIVAGQAAPSSRPGEPVEVR